VLRVQAAKLRGASDAHARAVSSLAEATLDARVGFEARAAQAAGVTAAALGPRLGQPASALATRLAALAAAGELVAAGDGDAAVYLHATVAAELEQRALAALDAAAERTLTREVLRGKLPAALPPRAFDVLLAALARRGAAEATADQVRRVRPGAVAPAASPLDRDLAARFEVWGVEPPRPAEVAAAIGQPAPAVRAALDRLIASRALTKVKPDLFVASSVIAGLRDRLIAHLDAHGEITPQQWKDLTGTTRKYAIPLAEHFDAEKVTLRVGDLRRRRK
jgi:selenocysteine-specific elongation factor